MPNRILRDWTDSQHVEQIGAEAERLFARLIMKADDYGRYHADPRLVMAGCFPLLNSITAAQVGDWLVELENARLIELYEVKGRAYLAILDFRQRKRLRHASKFPPKDGQLGSWQPSRDGHVTDNVTDNGQSNDGHESDDSSEVVNGEDSPEDLSACQSNDGHMTARATHTHTSPPTSSPPRGSGGIPPRLHGLPANLEEVVAYGRSCVPIIDEAKCRRFWSHYEGTARENPSGQKFWITKGGSVITNWRIKLADFDHPTSVPAEANGHKPPRKLFPAELKTMIQAKQEIVDKLRMKHAKEESGRFHWPKEKATERDECRKLISEIDGLKNQLASFTP